MAEQMQPESQPAYPLLYSLRGYQYCDLLLAAVERAAFMDCGSPLPLSRSQPAASAGGETTDEDSGSRDVVTRPDASRLAGESGSRLPQSKVLQGVAAPRKDKPRPARVDWRYVQSCVPANYRNKSSASAF